MPTVRVLDENVLGSRFAIHLQCARQSQCKSDNPYLLLATVACQIANYSLTLACIKKFENTPVNVITLRSSIRVLVSLSSS